MRLTAHPGSEVDFVRIAAQAAASVSRDHLPDIRQDDRASVLVGQASNPDVPMLDVVRVYGAIAEVAHQQIARISSETCGCDGNTPRRVQRAICSDLLSEVTVEVKLVDKSIAYTGRIVLLGRILKCERDEELV